MKLTKGNREVTFISGAPVDKLPKRVRGGTFDQAGSDVLFKLVSANPLATASDGVDYDTIEDARKKCGSAVRLLRKGHPEIGDRIATRTYGTNGDTFNEKPFRWIVYLRAEKAADTSEDASE